MTRRMLQLVVLLIVQVLTLHASAAEPDDLIIVPEFGFDGIIATERWAPIRFMLTSVNEPISGTLTLRYMQDGSQYVTTTRRFALTPGVPTPVDVGVCMARYNKGVGVTIRADSGRTLLREYIDFENPSRTRKIAFTPPMLVSEPITLLSVGLEGLAEAGQQWARGLYIETSYNRFVNERPSDQTIEHRLRVSALDPGSMYPFWSAYDGVKVVVVRASAITEMPQRARRALLAWQQGGGEIVVIVDDASITWRQWLPEGAPGEMLHLAEPRQTVTPGNFDSFPAHAAKSGIGDVDLAKPAMSMSARVITLTPLGESRGWEMIYELDEGPIASFAARGPAGLGFITIVGFDPERAMAVRSKKAASIAWGAVLERLLMSDIDSDTGQQFRYYASSSGSTPSESQAIKALVDATLQGEGLSLEVLMLVLAVLAAFVLAIGPVDALVLRRLRLRHWSWLSALGWVAVASVLAVQIPNLTMGGQTHIGRAAVTDTLFDNQGQIIASWTTGITTSYAGHAGTVGPDDRRPGSWWRGVSPLGVWQWGGNKPAGALSTLRLSQRSEAGEGGARMSTTPARLTQRGWTVRGMLDVTPEPPPVYARVMTDGQSRWLKLTPGSRAVTVEQAKVTIAGEQWQFDSLDTNASVVLDPEAAFAPKLAPETQEQAFRPFRQSYTENRVYDALPNAQTRWEAMKRWASGDSAAIVEIRYKSTQLPFETTGSDSTEEQGLVRIAVPITLQQPEHQP